MQSKKHVFSQTISLLFLLTACGDSPSDPLPNPNPPIEPGAPAAIVVVSGEGQEGIVGVELPNPIVARIVDDDGTAVPSATVSWVVTQGGGEVFAPVAESGSDGVAQNRWTLGTEAGGNEVEVRWINPANGSPVVLGVFSANAVPGPPAELTITDESPIYLSIGENISISLSAEDQYGNAILDPIHVVTWRSSEPSVATVDAAGLVTGIGSGSALVQAIVDSDTASIQMAVNPGSFAVYSLPNEAIITDISGNGSRILALAWDSSLQEAHDILAFDGSSWQLEYQDLYSLNGLTVDEDGESWAVRDFGVVDPDLPNHVVHSSEPGSWSEFNGSQGQGGNTDITGSQDGFNAYFQAEPPVVYGRLDDSNWPLWENINAPKNGPGGLVLSANSIAASSSSELYVGGLAEQTKGDGGDPYLLWWNGWSGLTWSFTPLPFVLPPTVVYGSLALAENPSGGPLLGYVADMNGSPVVEIEAGNARLLSSQPPISQEIMSACIGYDGRYHFVTNDLPGRVLWREGDEWEIWTAPGNWYLTACWVAPSGEIWVGAYEQAIVGHYILRIEP